MATSEVTGTGIDEAVTTGHGCAKRPAAKAQDSKASKATSDNGALVI